MNTSRRRRLPARASVACCLLISLSGVAAAADYTIEVRLDPVSRLLTGKQTITWTNAGQTAASDLQFHLYYNAWKNKETSFLNSNRIVKREFDDWKEDEWAYTRVDLLAVPARDGTVEYDLTPHLEFLRLDDGNANDETVLRAPLPEPVAPGETIEIKIEFEARVPRTFARTGYRGDYFFIAQWFPKLGVFEEDGTWNCHQFIQTEFYADFGTYDVSINVPEGWVVGATGQLTDLMENEDGTATHRYYQERVHDFAWTACPRFLVFEQRFEHPTLPGVNMRLLLMPDHVGQQDRYFAAARAGLKYYGEWFGEYPYEHVTIIDPAYRSNTGGMEYPTLFTGGARWLNTPNSGNPEGVTVHEYGHQIWYGVVANNEFEHAWLDEGFNTYSTRRTMLEAFGKSNLVKRYLDDFIPYQFDDIFEAPRTVSGLGGFHSELKLDIMSKTSWKYGPDSVRYGEEPSRRRDRVYSSGAYGVNSYTKPALMLLTLERYLGWETFQKIMSTYYQRWKFKHPEPRDFFAIVDEISGREMSWFWEQTYFSSNVFDYAVDGVRSEGDKRRVLVRRWGEGVFPVEVKFTFERSIPVTEVWDGQDRWKSFDFFLEKDDLVRVEVDPERKLALDVNTANNSWVRDDSAPFAGRKWSAKWMIWLQNLMQLFAFFS